MAVPNNIMHFRRQRADELRRFAEKLETYVGSGISTKLFEGISQLKDPDYIPFYRNNLGNRVNTDVNLWGYSIDDIKIDINAVRHLKPKEINKAEAYLSISLVSDFRSWKNVKDPFCELSFNVTIKGIKPNTKDGIHYFGFHLDRHHESQTSDEIHPSYHLQYNLNPKKNKDFDYGETLNIDSPRFLHYPMDLILGLSYLIASFQPLNYSKLIEDREVKKLIKEYQDSIWRPYSFTMSKHWRDDGSPVEWNKTAICPFLV
jgi:hypothetical protein